MIIFEGKIDQESNKNDEGRFGFRNILKPLSLKSLSCITNVGTLV